MFAVLARYCMMNESWFLSAGFVWYQAQPVHEDDCQTHSCISSDTSQLRFHLGSSVLRLPLPPMRFQCALLPFTSTNKQTETHKIWDNLRDFVILKVKEANLDVHKVDTLLSDSGGSLKRGKDKMLQKRKTIYVWLGESVKVFSLWPVELDLIEQINFIKCR